jgi:hypothetical protein
MGDYIEAEKSNAQSVAENNKRVLPPFWKARVEQYLTNKMGASRGRCYDHNFLRLSTIFGERIGVFLKNQCYDQNFA